MSETNKDYIAAKIFTNKRDLENQTRILSNIGQYAGANKNILLNTRAQLQQAIKNNIYKIKQDGTVRTIGMERERSKAKMKSTSKAMWALPVIGWVLYAILYLTRLSKFRTIKKEERHQLYDAITNTLITNPLFLKTAKQYVSDLNDREKEVYTKCLNMTQQKLSEAKPGQYHDIIDETIDYLQTEEGVNLDKTLLENLYSQSTPQEVKAKIQPFLEKQKYMQVSVGEILSNSQLYKNIAKQQQKNGQSLLSP